MSDIRNGTKFLSWQYIASIVILVVLNMAGYGYARHEKAIDKLDEKKADKEIVVRVEDRMTSIEDKLDNLIQMHLEKNNKNYTNKK